MIGLAPNLLAIFKLLGLLLSCLSWKWRKRSSVKMTERTHEEATEALHAGRVRSPDSPRNVQSGLLPDSRPTGRNTGILTPAASTSGMARWQQLTEDVGGDA